MEMRQLLHASFNSDNLESIIRLKETFRTIQKVKDNENIDNI